MSSDESNDGRVDEQWGVRWPGGFSQYFDEATSRAVAAASGNAAGIVVRRTVHYSEWSPAAAPGPSGVVS